MVKFYSSNYTYDYSFPAVSLAYFLRYPNPYSRHVSSTDTISRSFDPETQRLTTVRLHLKRSRLPSAVLQFLPKREVGTGGEGSSDGRAESFILETSTVDVREGWMSTESKNLDWNNVLSVIERHTYSRPPGSNVLTEKAGLEDRTDVAVSVTLKSRIGEQLRKRRQRWGEQATASSVAGGVGEEEPLVKQGWFSSWSSSAVRAAIETVSLQRTERSQPKAKEGMAVVLQRLRHGGIQEVLEGMKADREVVV
ncbi:hypothetical protein LTR62_000750 [Meristemomyces frigidus]|uniref:PRELI/MSF1 domain-containing protein n=1 Tax=Meristemomyces frigidus TaxID=1508187 RepID=A0AAN7T9Y0_9PEZI|nr:hypothetical protein LTR62_000750 [Meristemomyces frigidus]